MCCGAIILRTFGVPVVASPLKLRDVRVQRSFSAIGATIFTHIMVPYRIASMSFYSTSNTLRQMKMEPELQLTVLF